MIHAMTFFSDGSWYIWDGPKYKRGDKPRLVHFRKGTVVVNGCLLEFKMYRASEVFAVTHECCHLIKDEKFFSKHKDTVASICKANDSKRVYWKNGEPTIELIERQNDYLTAAVLMPREQTKMEFFKSMRRKTIPEEPIPLEVYMRPHIAKLAKIYGVNFNVVKYRLQDIGVLEDPRGGNSRSE